MSKFYGEDDFVGRDDFDNNNYSQRSGSPKAREERECEQCGAWACGDLDRLNDRVFFCFPCWDEYTQNPGLRRKILAGRNRIKQKLQQLKVKGLKVSNTDIEAALFSANWNEAQAFVNLTKKYGIKDKPAQTSRHKPVAEVEPPTPQLDEKNITPIPTANVTIQDGLSEVRNVMAPPRNETETENHEASISPKQVVSPKQVISPKQVVSPKPVAKPCSNLVAIGDSPMSKSQVNKNKKKRNALVEEKLAQQIKPNINLVVVGHVDAGKSTLMGHVLFKVGEVTQKEMHKCKMQAAANKKESFAFAFALDLNESERSRGVTIDVSLRYFELPNRYVTLFDCPGHRDFISSMITGASQAECAILVVNAARTEFEAGLKGQTKEHAILIQSLGVKQVIIAVNKMDSVDWDIHRYNEIIDKMKPFLRKLGFKKNKIRTIPISGWTGENLDELTPNCEWYDGPTLLEMINTFKKPNISIEKTFRMCVTDVYKTQTEGNVIAGKIDAGAIMVGDQIYIRPANVITTVRRIYDLKNKRMPVGIAGENVQLNVGFEDLLTTIYAGHIACDLYDYVKLVSKFECKIYTLDISRPIVKGNKVNLHIQSREIPATISKLKASFDKTGELIKEKPRHLFGGKHASVSIIVDRPIPLETFEDFKHLGRVMIRRDGDTIAVGVVTKISEKHCR